MAERKLATIRQIKDVQPIKNADFIELAFVDGWQCVVKKGEFNKGDKCVYFEIDSFLPIRDEFEFLRKSSYRKNHLGEEGFRLKTVKLRKHLSQGLALPLEIFNGSLPNEDIGTDVTQELNVKKWEDPIPVSLSGKVKGKIPGDIPKTDEERIQNLEDQLENWKKDELSFVVTEKLDGTSAQFYLKGDEFGVCSRNLVFEDGVDNVYMQIAEKFNLKELMLELRSKIVELEDFSVQGEIIGPKIQKNIYNLKEHQFRPFNVYNIRAGEFLPWNYVKGIAYRLDLEYVPFLGYVHISDFTNVDDFLQFAEGKSELNPEQEREGVVLKVPNNSLSFKAINNKFLL